MRPVFVLVAFLLFSFPANAAAPAQTSTPLVKAVYFHADWCPNCRILDPIYAKAKAQAANRPVQFIRLDFTNNQTWDASMQTALDADIVETYNAYAPSTGFVILAAADTGERITCLHRLQTAAVMLADMQRAVKQVQQQPPGHRGQAGVLCPAPRALPQ